MEHLRHIWDRIVVPLPLVSASGSEGVLAHHGFGSFDIRRALYIEGRVVRLDWTDPHIGLKIEVLPGLRVPPDLHKVRVLTDNPLAITVPAEVGLLPIGSSPEIWDLTLSSLERAEQVGLRATDLQPGSKVAGVGYQSCDVEMKEFRPDLLILDRRGYALRPFALPPTTCE